MNKLELFFDYSCPYCLRGHEYLVELFTQEMAQRIQIEWRPCEAHPRPEPGPHSDLALQGMFIAQESGVDLWAYHDRMYRAMLIDKIDRENIDALGDYVADLLDAGAFKKALREGAYAKALLDNNDYAYEKSGVWAIPSYRMNGQKLDSVEGVGVTKAQLADFLNLAK